MEISEQVITIFDDIGERLGVAIDWSQKDLLPYLQELFGRYIDFEIATSIFWIVVTFAATAILAVISFVLFKKLDLSYDDAMIFLVTIVAFAILFFVIFIVVLMIQAIDIITCITFPEKIILDALLMTSA